MSGADAIIIAGRDCFIEESKMLTVMEFSVVWVARAMALALLMGTHAVHGDVVGGPFRRTDTFSPPHFASYEAVLEYLNIPPGIEGSGDRQACYKPQHILAVDVFPSDKPYSYNRKCIYDVVYEPDLYYCNGDPDDGNLPWNIKKFPHELKAGPGQFLDLTADQVGNPEGCIPLTPEKFDPWRNTGEPQMCPAGNPIHPATGNKFQKETDFSVPGPFPIAFTRFYNSEPRYLAVRSDLGTRWSHEYQRVIEVLSTTQIVLRRQDGRAFKATKSGGVWTLDSDVPGVIAENGGGWIFTNALSEKENYNSSGALTSLVSSAGYKLTFDINGEGQVTHIRDHFNTVKVTFTYANVGDESRMVKAQVPDSGGAQYDFVYGVGGILTTVKYPDSDDDGSSTSRENNFYREYLYAEPSHMHDPDLGPLWYPGALTGIVDKDLPRFATYKYDASGRAWHSSHADGVDEVELEYLSAPQLNGQSVVPGETKIIDATGHEAVHSFTVYKGEGKSVGLSAPCSSCGTTIGAATYGTNGLRASQDDLLGNRTLFAHASKLEVCRLEGIPPASSIDNADKAFRLTTTAWDPTARLPALTTSWEPIDPTMANPTTCPTTPDPDVWRKRREVESVFVAGTGKIYQRKERSFFGASQDETERVTTYTYYSDTSGDLAPLQGMLQRVDGPRTDVDDYTDFAYITAATRSENNHPNIGDLWKVTRKVDATVSLTTEVAKHDVLGRPLEVLDRNGTVTTVYQYHPRGWLASSAVAGQNATTYLYSDRGSVTRVTLPDGSYLRYEYDDVNRLRDIFDTDGNQMHYGLDALGNRTVEETKDPSGTLKRKIVRVFDARNQLAKITHGDGATVQSTAYQYHPNGTLAREIDPRDPFADPSNTTPTIATSYSYDALNRRRTVIDPENGATYATETVFDISDAVVSVNDPAGLVTTYTRNGFGEVKSLSSPDSGVTTYTYDTAGNQITRTDARQLLSTITYDAIGRIKSIDHAGNSQDIAYTYDETAGGSSQNCNVPRNGIGQLTSVTDESGSTKYYYDEKGNPVCKEVLINGSGWGVGTTWVTRYAYDVADRLLEMTYPSGTFVRYVRNVAGQVEGVEVLVPGESQVRTLVNNVEYMPFGPVKSWRYETAIQSTRLYDLDYRLTDLQYVRVSGQYQQPAILLSHYDYDKAGNVLSITDANPYSWGGYDFEFTYDALSRVKSEDGPPGYDLVNQGYDRNGNRTEWEMGGYGESFIRDVDPSGNLTSNRLLGTSSSPVPRYEFDAMGNRLEDLAYGHHYRYGSNGRLFKIWDEFLGNETDDFYQLKHNASGLAVYEDGDSEHSSTHWPYYLHYDEEHRLLTEMNPQAYVQPNDYVYLDGIPIGYVTAQAGNPQVRDLWYVLTDHLGAPLFYFDTYVSGGGEVTEMAAAVPLTSGTGYLPPLEYLHNPRLGRPGQIWASTPFWTGMYLNHHREYEWLVSRYLQSDPIGLDGGINTYAYANNNPLRYTDPFGLEPNQACVAGCAVAGGVIGGGIGYVGGGLIGGGGGTLVAPGVGTIGGAIGGAEIGGAAGAAAGTAAGSAVGQAFCPDDEPECSMATPYQLLHAGITDPHEFKRDYVGGSISRYDICACKDGAIKLAGRGQCGQSGPKIDTWARWK